MIDNSGVRRFTAGDTVHKILSFPESTLLIALVGNGLIQVWDSETKLQEIQASEETTDIVRGRADKKSHNLLVLQVLCISAT